MSEILLVNPRRRKKRRMSAKQRKYFGKRRSHKRRRTVAVKINPRRRRRNPSVRHHRRRRHRNPSVRGIFNQVLPTVKSGAIGALGGLGNDVLFGFINPKLPAALQTGWGQTAAKMLSAILVGVAGNMVLKGKGRDLAVGAATIALHDAFKPMLASSFPSLPLADAYDNVGYVDAASQVNGMGSYISGGESFVNDQILGDSSGMNVNDDILGEYITQ